MKSDQLTWGSVFESVLEAVRPATLVCAPAADTPTAEALEAYCAEHRAVAHVIGKEDPLDTLLRVEDADLVVFERSLEPEVAKRALQLIERRTLDGGRFPTVLAKGWETVLEDFTASTGLGLALVRLHAAGSAILTT